MKLVCPSCGEAQLGVRQKLTSTLLFPASCDRCRALVATRPGLGSVFIYVVIQEALLYGTIIIAFLRWSWWPLITGGAAILLLPYVLWWRSPLLVRTAAQVRRDRRNAAIGVLVLVALVILAGTL